MLIAGFCCVDFSPLNKNQKHLESTGESGDTLRAIHAYCKRLKPKSVILENVSGAPWTKPSTKTRSNIASLFKEIGYVAVYLKLDSKRFGIPQTRNRGYMLLIRRSLFSSQEQQSRLVQAFADLVKELQFLASAPLERWIHSSDDTTLRNAIDNVRTGKPKKSSNWDKCREGHDVYRDDLRLGPNRPVTRWSRDGYPKVPDFFLPFHGQSNRIWDTIDIAHLRDLQRGVDDRYYK